MQSFIQKKKEREIRLCCKEFTICCNLDKYNARKGKYAVAFLPQFLKD